MRPVFFVFGVWTVASGAFAFEKAIDPANKKLVKTVVKTIPSEIKYEFSRVVGPGRLVKIQDGEPGKVVKSIQITLQDGKPVRSQIIKVERTEPTPTIFHMGKPSVATSRGSFTRGKVMTMSASAYDPSAGRGRHATFRTATGMRAQFGVVAVDPRVIPLGTRVFVEGYGFAIAADTGGAIKGNKIDLCYPTRGQCMQFGRRKVQVHVLKGR